MTPFDTEKNQKWIQQAQQGSPLAFARLYEEIYQDLYRFALYTMKNPYEAEDVVSESILIGYANIKSLRKTEAFKSWLFQIVSNQCRKRFVAKEKIQPTDDPATFDMILPGDIGDNLSLREAFYQLNNEERLIVALSVFGKYNSREIGEILKLNAVTIRSKLSRAFEKLRSMLEDS